MRICYRADDCAVVLRQRLQGLASELSELEDLRTRVLEAQQKAARTPRKKRSCVPAFSGPVRGDLTRL